MEPEHESAFGLQEPIRHSKSAEFPCFGFWPNIHWVTIMQTLFDLFAKGCVWIQTLIVRTYFLGSSVLYKKRLNFIIQHFFLYSERQTFWRLTNC